MTLQSDAIQHPEIWAKFQDGGDGLITHTLAMDCKLASQYINLKVSIT